MSALPGAAFEAPMLRHRTRTRWGRLLPVLVFLCGGMGMASDIPWLGLPFLVVLLLSLPIQGRSTHVRPLSGAHFCGRPPIQGQMREAITDEPRVRDALARAVAALPEARTGTSLPPLPLTFTLQSHRPGCRLTVYAPTADTALHSVRLADDSPASRLVAALASLSGRHPFVVQETSLQVSFRIDALSAHARLELCGASPSSPTPA